MLEVVTTLTIYSGEGQELTMKRQYIDNEFQSAQITLKFNIRFG